MRSLSDHYLNIDLHLGAHRTGTSSLQAVLHLMKDRIRGSGFDVMAPPVSGLRAIRNHRESLQKALKLVRSLETNKKGFFGRFAEKRALESAITELAKFSGMQNQKLILSEENLIWKAMDLSLPASLYPRAGERLEDFAKICGQNVGSIFIAIRPYSDFMISYVAMSSVYGAPKISLEDLEGWAIGQFSGWPELVGKIQKAFPNATINIWPHSRINIPERFEHLTGIDRMILPTTEMPGLNQTPTLQAIKQVTELKRDTVLTKSQLDAIVEKYAFGKVPSKEQFFSYGMLEQLDKLYERHVFELSNHSSATIRVI